MIRKVTRFTKITIISILLLFASLAIIAGIIYNLYPEESVKQIVKEKSEVLLNRKIEIGSLHYSPKGIVIENVKIYDRDQENRETLMIKANEAVITFSLFSIIKKDFKLRTLYFNGLEVNCIFDNDGNSNIQNLISELKLKAGGGDKNIQLSKIILTDCRAKMINLPQFIKPLDGEYLIDGSVYIEDNNIFRIKDCRLILPGKRGVLYPELTLEATGNFKIRGKVKLENASLQWVYKFSEHGLQLPYDVVNGNVTDLEITKDYVKGHAKAYSTLRNTKSIIHADGWCTVEIDSRDVILKDIKGRINSSSANVDNLVILTKVGGLRKFSFSNVNFQLDDLHHIVDFFPSSLSGTVRGGLSYDGKFFNGKIDTVDLAYRNNIELFRGLNTTIEISNNNFRKENIPVIILGSSSRVSIATTDNKFKNFYVFINSEKININDIKIKESASGSGSESAKSAKSSFNLPVNVTGKINVKELVYDDYNFRNTDANLSVSGNIIKVNNLQTSFLSGSISGIGTVDISGSSPAVQTSIKFNNIKVHDMKFRNEKLNSRFFGFADGTANLNLVIKENAAETIKGNAVFTISKGKVVNTGVQDGLIIFLSELRYKLKDLEFNKIYGNFEISGNNFKINSFIFNSEDLRLSMSGRLNKDLIAESMQMKLEFNNHFIKDIPRPAVAVFNEYANGKWYIIPFSMNGNITESKNIKMIRKNQ